MKVQFLTYHFEKDSFQFNLATYMLEHVEDASKAVKEIVRVLGGIALITVPTLPPLWRIQNVVGNITGDINEKELIKFLRIHGLLVDEKDCYYFNFFSLYQFGSLEKGFIYYKRSGDY